MTVRIVENCEWPQNNVLCYEKKWHPLLRENVNYLTTVKIKKTIINKIKKAIIK